MQDAKYLSILALSLISTQAFCFQFSNGYATAQVGGFISDQGQDQNIGIRHIRGNKYTVTQGHDGNVLFGLGYLAQVYDSQKLALDLGINAFYLAKTSVDGEIVQEYLFSNLGYHYTVTHIPVYALAKARIKNNSNRFTLLLDAGIGPNFNKTNAYHEWTINGSNALPGGAFSGKSNTEFSATAGIGVRINNVIGEKPLECGYRFFYLGKGEFTARNDQWINNLNTGNSYANALVCGIVL